MGAEMVVAESDYVAITQWEDDGAPALDIAYRVVPDPAADGNLSRSRRALKSGEEGDGRAEEAAGFEVAEFANA